MSLLDRLPALKPPPAAQPAWLRAKRYFLELGARCETCPLAKARPVRTQWAGREAVPTLALVGEAPGRREVMTGQPFVGPSGKLLNFACAQAGIDRRRLAVMNAVACGPIPSGAEVIKRRAMEACRPRLLAELRALRPRGVVAIGAYALKALAPEGTSGVSVLRGAMLELASDVVMGSPGGGADNRLAAGSRPLTFQPAAPLLSHRATPSSSIEEVEAPAQARAAALIESVAQAPASAAPAPTGWAPIFTATLHPAHILRGGDGEQENPESEASSSVDLLYYFFMFDLAKAWRFAVGELRPWQDECDLFVVSREGYLHRATTTESGLPLLGARAVPRELREALGRVYEEAKQVGELACDVETDRRDSFDARLTSIAYATVLGGTAATWRAWRLDDATFRLLQEIHADRNLWWDWHNGIYDRVVFDRHGIPIVGHSHDTLLEHHAAFPGLPHRLDQVATQYFVTAPWKDEFRTSTKDECELVVYNFRDAFCTARLRPAIYKSIVANRTERVYEADRQQNVIATRMRLVGFYVDEAERQRHRKVQSERLEYMRGQLAQDFAAIEKTWREVLARRLADRQRKHDPDNYMARVALRHAEIGERRRSPTDIGLFKPKAKDDLVALFNVLRIPFAAYTRKGAPVTDKKAMEKAGAQHPLMRKLIHIREAQHLISTYIDLPVKEDGRFHPDWKTNKITGRWGAGKSQNWPNNVAGWPPYTNPDGSFRVNGNGTLITPRENLRSIVAAPTAAQVLEVAARNRALVDPQVLARAEAGFGRMLVGADEDQVELRIIAFLSKDPLLLDLFNSGKDPHSHFAGEVIFTEAFPRLTREIIEAGYPKPKDAIDLLEDQIAEITGEDDISRARREKLKLVLDKARAWKRLRDLAKRFEYGGVYGGEAPALHAALVNDFPEIGLRDVEEGLKRFRAAVPGVVRWWATQETYARLHREVREIQLGRARLFPLGNFNPNVTRNFPVQAYNAGLVAKAMFRFVALTQPGLLELDRLYERRLLDPGWVLTRRSEGYGQWKAPVELLLNGHDSLLAEADEEDAPRAAKLMELAFTQHDIDPRDGARMDYVAKAHVARRWSRA